jgi:Ribonuclease G/E
MKTKKELSSEIEMIKHLADRLMKSFPTGATPAQLREIASLLQRVASDLWSIGIMFTKINKKEEDQ